MNAPNRAQFLADRLSGLGGSDAAPALGLSPWKSPLQLYLEKIGEGDPVEENDAMRFGILLEPVVRDEYARRTGRNVIFGQRAYRSSEHPFMLANLDGMAIGEDRRVLEVKTARDDREWGEPGTDNVPQAYLLQVTHYMIVTGAQLADIAVLIGGSDFRIYTVPLKPELAELVIEGERQFWDAVERRDPPAPSTLAEINLRWRASNARTVDLPPNVAKAVERLAELRDQTQAIEEEAERCEAIVKMEMRDADTGLIDGVPAVTWRQAKPGKVLDLKRLRAERADVVSEYEYEKPGTRRFLLKL
jgi:putative phage-type endonuclease